MAYQKRSIGGWTAASNGLQPGRNIEYVVEEITVGNGAAFKSVAFYKPYQSKKPEKAGQWERGFNFRIEDHAELIERVNHMLQNYSTIPGRYVFQPMTGQVQQPQQPVQQQNYQPPQPQYTPTPAVQPPPVQQYQPQYQPPTQPQYAPATPVGGNFNPGTGNTNTNGWG